VCVAPGFVCCRLDGAVCVALCVCGQGCVCVVAGLGCVCMACRGCVLCGWWRLFVFGWGWKGLSVCVNVWAASGRCVFAGSSRFVLAQQTL